MNMSENANKNKLEFDNQAPDFKNVTIAFPATAKHSNHKQVI